MKQYFNKIRTNRKIYRNTRRLLYLAGREKEFLSRNVKITYYRSDQFRHTFFGYYDRKPCSPSGKKILCILTNEDKLQGIAHIALFNVNSGVLEKISTTKMWNFQQGAQQQWINDEHFIFNTISNSKRPSSQVWSVEGKYPEKQFPWHIGMINRKKYLAVSYNFSHLSRWEKDYGYSEIGPDIPLEKDSICLRIFCLKSGNIVHSIKLGDLLEYITNGQFDTNQRYFWIQHAKFNCKGTKILFVLRSISKDTSPEKPSEYSFLFTFDIERGVLDMVFPASIWKYGANHPVWISDNEILMNIAEAKYSIPRFITFENYRNFYIKIGKYHPGVGHPTLTTDSRLIITDERRYTIQSLIVVNAKSGKRTLLASFKMGGKKNGPLRCDLHPRILEDKDSLKICFDVNNPIHGRAVGILEAREL